MTIDKSGLNSLIKYKGGIVRSDHMEANLVFHKEQKHERLSVFNVKKNTRNIKKSC